MGENRDANGRIQTENNENADNIGDMAHIMRAKTLDSKHITFESELQQKLMVMMLLSAMAIFVLLCSWLLQEEQQEVKQASQARLWPAPNVLQDYIEYSELAENELRK